MGFQLPHARFSTQGVNALGLLVFVAACTFCFAHFKQTLGMRANLLVAHGRFVSIEQGLDASEIARGGLSGLEKFYRAVSAHGVYRRDLLHEKLCAVCRRQDHL